MDEKGAPKASRSNNVLDLRAGGAAKPARPVAKRAAHPKPAPKPQPAPAVKEESTYLAAAGPLEEELTRPAARSKEFVDASLESKGRFWPAFWRFLLLLIVLGLVLTGGLYLYLNFYAT